MRMRSAWFKMAFLNLMEVGVTSTYSSSAMNSKQRSKLRIVGGVSFNASSLPLARLFVRCFVLHTLTVMSSSRLFSPTTIPAYTGKPGVTNKVQRSCALNKP